MPHRRHVKKGSFGGHFDELVTQFPQDEARRDSDNRHRKSSKDDGSIHDKLFESAWHKARGTRSSA